MDVVVVVLLTLWMLLVIVPFVNAISISFATQKEYVDNPLMLFPSQPTLQSYKVLLNDYRIWVGFRTSFLLVVVGVPVSMLLTTMLASAEEIIQEKRLLSAEFSSQCFLMGVSFLCTCR